MVKWTNEFTKSERRICVMAILNHTRKGWQGYKLRS
jgi:hypothetical protein